MFNGFIFFVGLLVGTITGALLVTIMMPNRIEEAWNNGYRAGKYRDNNNI